MEKREHDGADEGRKEGIEIAHANDRGAQAIGIGVGQRGRHRCAQAGDDRNEPHVRHRVIRRGRHHEPDTGSDEDAGQQRFEAGVAKERPAIGSSWARELEPGQDAERRYRNG
jgi:hypothetical protein